MATRFRIDPVRSTVTAVVRPMLDGRGPLEATIAGVVEVSEPDGDHPSPVVGEIHIRLVDGSTELALRAADTSPEVEVDHDGLTILRGSADRPAGVVGLTGPPLLNPTVVLRWRAVLEPDD